jgi:hypothetical protein
VFVPEDGKGLLEGSVHPQESWGDIKGGWGGRGDGGIVSASISEVQIREGNSEIK